MIEHLTVNNIALIESLEIEFGNGLNIISGETGSGKTTLIDSINFLLGGRAGKELIRYGADSAYVEGIFSISDAVRAQLIEYGIELSADDVLIISRTLSPGGRGVCRVNSRAVTVSQLKEIAALLVDVHGQHEHQSLLDPNKHIKLLDQFCGDALDECKSEMTQRLRGYRDTLSRIRLISGAEKTLDMKIELLTEQKNEIEAVKPGIDEENSLEERRLKLLNSEALTENTRAVLELLYDNDDGGGSAVDRVSRSAAYLHSIAELDSRLLESAEVLESISAQLSDIVMDVRHYNARLEHDPSELAEVDERLNEIYKLKRKYGGSVSEVLARYENILTELESIADNERELSELNSDKKRFTEELMLTAKKMSELRGEAGRSIREGIMSELNELGMRNAVFEVGIERKKEFGVTGYDKVEFLIATNPGEHLKPLARIASGGEISRIMLAMKAVLADADNIETFIFDEIDSGVSGRTAQKVAEKLNMIAGKRQILCITHLPQIAAMSDKHFLIEKVSDENTSRTLIKSLDYDKSVRELARLIGGAAITEATLAAADELKRQAIAVKG